MQRPGGPVRTVGGPEVDREVEVGVVAQPHEAGADAADRHARARQIEAHHGVDPVAALGDRPQAAVGLAVVVAHDGGAAAAAGEGAGRGGGAGRRQRPASEAAPRDELHVGAAGEGGGGDGRGDGEGDGEDRKGE